MRIIGACILEPALAQKVPPRVLAMLRPFARAVVVGLRYTKKIDILTDSLVMSGFDRAHVNRWGCAALDAIPDPCPDWRPVTLQDLKLWLAAPTGATVEEIFNQAIRKC